MLTSVFANLQAELVFVPRSKLYVPDAPLTLVSMFALAITGVDLEHVAYFLALLAGSEAGLSELRSEFTVLRMMQSLEQMMALWLGRSAVGCVSVYVCVCVCGSA